MMNDLKLNFVCQELNLPIENLSAKGITKKGNIEERIQVINSAIPSTINYSSITVTADGFIDRTIFIDDLFLRSNNVTLRLIRSNPVGYLERLDYCPGDNVIGYYHSYCKVEFSLCRHGEKLERVQTLGNGPAFLQSPNDTEDVVLDGMNWQSNLEFSVPNNLNGGLYSIQITSLDTNELFHSIPLIINTPKEEQGKKSKVLLLASNTTWQSYNLYGGRSRYRFNRGKKPIQFKKKKGLKLKLIQFVGLITPVFLKRVILTSKPMREQPVDWKFRRLSVRRPFTNLSLEAKDPNEKFLNHLAGGEWRVIAWMEREKISYDYCSGTMLNFSPELLEKYDAIVLSTHCEYWSKSMYDSLKNAHEKGLWIINISGNTMYREIEFFNDGSIRCKNLSFKDSCADETELIGGRFDPLDYGTAAPYKVTDREHWIYDGIDIPSDNLVGKKSLNTNIPRTTELYDPGRIGRPTGLDGEGASGWECDKRPCHQRKRFHLIAKGTNPKGGAEMVIKDTNGVSGGVFSVGSITFGGALLVDTVLSHMVKNVFKKVLK